MDKSRFVANGDPDEAKMTQMLWWVSVFIVGIIVLCMALISMDIRARRAAPNPLEYKSAAQPIIDTSSMIAQEPSVLNL